MNNIVTTAMLCFFAAVVFGLILVGPDSVLAALSDATSSWGETFSNFMSR